MCLLFKFNKYFLVPLVTEWLELYDFILLSCSVTKVCTFSQLLGVLQTYPEKVNKLFEHSSLALSDKFISWLDSKKLFPLLNIQLDEKLLAVFKPDSFFNSLISFINGSEKMEAKRRILEKRHYVRGMTLRCNVDMELCIASTLASQFSKLQELNLTRHSATYKKNSNWMNNSFIYLLHLCPQLRKLTIDDVIIVPDHLFFMLVVWCRQLKSLIFPTRWMGAVAWRQSLLVFTLHSCCPIATAMIPENGALVLKAILAYSGSSVQKVCITECYFALSHLQHDGYDLSSITSLHIDYKYESQLLPLKEALPGLKELYVDNVQKDARVEELLSSGLPIVHLHCKYLPVDYLRTYSSGCSGITSLDLSYYALLRDEALGVVAAACPSLTQVNLSYNSLITDEGLLAVILMGRLVRLNVMITYLTALTLRNLVEYCPKFQYLGMSVSVITEQDVFEFVARCRTLRELFCYVFQTTTPSLDQCVRKINSRVKVLLDTGKSAITGKL